MSRRTEKSQAAFTRARQVLVGGVNSPVRAYAAVGGTPPMIAKAAGATVTDIDDNTYVDYVGSWGPAILGHAPETVVSAVAKAIRNGLSFGAPCEAETRLGEAVVAAVPSIQKVRFVSSGTEAVMSAVRLARGATGRDKILKCIGGYHGHSDAMLVSAGSGAATLGVPSSPGVPPGATAETLLVPYNDSDAVKAVLEANPGEVAAMLVEPVAANMGLVPPRAGYLEALRAICDEHGTLLIFDEVITGFRLALGGAQERFGVLPDVTTLGKIVGGGMPVGAYGGSTELMAQLSPEGPVYQAGTLSGNPVAMAAGLATLEALRAEGFYEAINARTERLCTGLAAARDGAGLAGKVQICGVQSMAGAFFTGAAVATWDDVKTCNTEAFASWHATMLDEGVYLAPSQFEAMFVSAAHTDDDIDRTVAAAEKAFSAAGKLL